MVRLLWDAKKVLAVFWYFLSVLKDCFVGAADVLTGEPLSPDARAARERRMSEQLEAARRELREALAVARASLAQVRNRPVPVVGRDRRPRPLHEDPDDDV